ncbi:MULTISPECIES: 50S ribosomal protein L7/L12 [Thermomonosporaceae]|uniref:50S ribosomal protein L7/L12 n=1 Tax=Thermomonosporaceae TaxID=2012 RepID=UPI00255A93B4|nr:MULTISPECIES: 50S ribosomal protein L7/L12 [Thermomonosporaceae]MDL4775658.1 50S ribosomal protein L7/L12 [Actinomadura xylanilytica]
MFRKRAQPLEVDTLSFEAAGVPAATRDRALRLIRQDRMIHAIKEVRTDTRLSLRDAKDYVEALRDGLVPGQGGPGGEMLSDRVHAFLREEDVESAIAIVRAETGLTRAEAERFVAALD